MEKLCTLKEFIKLDSVNYTIYLGWKKTVDKDVPNIYSTGYYMKWVNVSENQDFLGRIIAAYCEGMHKEKALYITNPEDATSKQLFLFTGTTNPPEYLNERDFASQAAMIFEETAASIGTNSPYQDIIQISLLIKEIKYKGVDNTERRWQKMLSAAKEIVSNME